MDSATTSDWVPIPLCPWPIGQTEVDGKPYARDEVRRQPPGGEARGGGLGQDPLMFEALARRHIAENSDSWRNAKHRAQWLSSLATYVFPSLGSMRVDEISRRDVIETLSPIWTSKPETARRGRQRIRAVMDRAVAMEYVDYNPAGRRHQCRPCQTAPRQEPPPCPALQGSARGSPSSARFHRERSGEAGLRDAGTYGLPLR